MADEAAGETKALSPKMERAAGLVAEDQQSNEAIAAAIGIKRQTLDLWKRRPDFAARVEAIRQQWRAQIEQEGIANRQNRIAALNDRWRKLQQIIEARAADPTMTAPGSDTGLLVRTYKPGKYKTVEEYRVDVGLAAELRAHEKQAAEELGQWTKKTDVTSGGKPLDLASLVLWARGTEGGGAEGGSGAGAP